MKFLRMIYVVSALTFIPLISAQASYPVARDGGHDDHGGGGYGHEEHGGGYEQPDHGGGGGGGYGHEKGGYKPAPPKKCHPQTITKYKTIHKDRKADVYNQVEVLNPQPHVKKIKETRDTTIRYPVFITQVIKPLLTQVETKVKPVFFTKTINKYTTVLFTVTGIGQVTVTSVKYEKEYITRCQKKGYGHHRREYEEEVGPAGRDKDVTQILDALVIPHNPAGSTQVVLPPPGIPYDISAVEPKREWDDSYPEPGPAPRVPPRHQANRRRPQRQPNYPPRKGGNPHPHPPKSSISPLFRKHSKNINRSGPPNGSKNGGLPFKIGDVQDLYMEDIYYYGNVERSGKALDLLEPSHTYDQTISIVANHPSLEVTPLAIVI